VPAHQTTGASKEIAARRGSALGSDARSSCGTVRSSGAGGDAGRDLGRFTGDQPPAIGPVLPGDRQQVVGWSVAVASQSVI